MRRMLLGIVTLFIFFVSLLFIARLVGSLNPPSSAILKDYQCTPQPCWRGIRPNTTSLTEAKTIVASDKALKITRENDSVLCWSQLSSLDLAGCFSQFAEESQITWYFPHSPFYNGSLLLGESVNIFGNPVGLKACYMGIDGTDFETSIFFENGIEVIGQPYGISKSINLIDLPVTNIIYNAPTDKSVSRWKGFTSIFSILYC